MSYILDALKKSEEERQRGAVPDLSTVHTPSGSKTKRRTVWLYALSAGLVLNAGVLVWWLSVRQPVGQEPHIATQTVPPATPAPPLRKDETPPADSPPAQSVATSRSVPVQEKAPPNAAATSGGAAVPTAQPAQTSPQQKKVEATADQKRGAKVPKDTGTRAPDNRTAETDATPERTSPPPIPPPVANKLYTVSELPEPLRQTLPTFTISVALYSEDAASRMVRINDQVMREGQYLSAGLRLEEITRDSVILSYQNYRFRVALK